MPKVSQAHLDARRQQIIDAARNHFASHGFARTSMSQLVKASGLSNGAIYRYFSSKDEIVKAICAETSQSFPTELTADAIDAFLQTVRTLELTEGHARLVTQIFAEAAVTPSLAEVVKEQVGQMRASTAALLPDHAPQRAAGIAEVFVALCHGYTQQLAIQGDTDPAPYTAALLAVTRM